MCRQQLDFSVLSQSMQQFLQIGNLIGNPIENQLDFFLVDFSSRKLKYFKFSASSCLLASDIYKGGSGLVWCTQSILQVFLFVVFFRPVSFSSVVLQFLCLPQLLEINMLTLFSARPANVLIKTCSDSSLLAAGMFGLQNLNSHEHVSV